MRSHNGEAIEVKVRQLESGEVRVKSKKLEEWIAGGRANGDGLKPLCLPFLFSFCAVVVVAEAGRDKPLTRSTFNSKVFGQGGSQKMRWEDLE